MKIVEIRLKARDLVAQKEFYSGKLKLPVVSHTTDMLTFHAGQSRLTFRQAGTGNEAVSTHFAFNIPNNLLPESVCWLQEGGVGPLVQNGGINTFHSKDWNADMTYFVDPEGNIVEFIARYDLPNASSTPFTEKQILNISEFGIGTNDVPTLRAELVRYLDARTYKNEDDPTFAALGDADGLFILVSCGRPWFPTTDYKASLDFAEVTVENDSGAEIVLAFGTMGSFGGMME